MSAATCRAGAGVLMRRGGPLPARAATLTVAPVATGEVAERDVPAMQDNLVDPYRVHVQHELTQCRDGAPMHAFSMLARSRIVTAAPCAETSATV